MALLQPLLHQSQHCRPLTQQGCRCRQLPPWPPLDPMPLLLQWRVSAMAGPCFASLDGCFLCSGPCVSAGCRRVSSVAATWVLTVCMIQFTTPQRLTG